MEHEISLAGPWLGAIEATGDESPVLTVIEQRAARAGIQSSIQRVQPLENDQVRIWFAEANADSWLTFVDSITLDGLTVSSASLTRASEGKINTRVTLKR